MGIDRWTNCIQEVVGERALNGDLMVLINMALYLFIIAATLRFFNRHMAFAALLSGIDMKVQANQHAHAIMKVNGGTR
jgi:hypothetical protein